ncbi:MAG: AsmA family protein, partial [Prolixibacteraceae bacterium]|nr:AsmA family protein [Prolixibacteraceae bacterium]
MSKSGIIIKRIIKVLLWVASGLVLLFILVALLIQIPSVQNKIVDFAASYVSSKTKTRVEIENVKISFPKAIVLEGIYVEDTQTDTLIYAGKVKVNIALYDLFSNKINIGSFVLEDATIKLSRSQTDPLFNYNFLITTFSDTTKQVDKNSLTPGKWTFSLDKVNLKKVLFTYNDVRTGTNVFAAIEKSDIRVMEIAPKKSLYAFNELLLRGLTVDIQRSDPANTQTKNQKKILPKITAKKLQINNSSVTYSDSVNYLSVISGVDHLELADASIDIQEELLISNRLSLAKSDIRYHNFKPEFLTGSIAADIGLSSGNNWKIKVNRMNMADNSFIYRVGDFDDVKKEFNPDYLKFAHLTFA